MLYAVTVESSMRAARLRRGRAKALVPILLPCLPFLSMALGHEALEPFFGPLHHDEMP
jgi:hypothetical protein